MLWGKGSPVEPGSAPQVGKSVSTTTLLRAVIVVVAVAALAWFGWHKYSEHQATEQTKDVTASTEQAMQHYFDTDGSVFKYRVKVLRVDLNKVGDNKFEGVATVNTAQSSAEHLVPITVTSFSDRMMWQAEPGAFMFLAQEALAQ